MLRQTAPSAASAIALQAAQAPAQVAAATRPGLVTEALGQAGSKDALARLNAAIHELKAVAVQPMLQRAVTALQADDFVNGRKWAIKALERDERSGPGWYLLAIAMERGGDFATSIKAYESALRLLPDQAEVANDLGRLAFRMGMASTAEKLFRHFLARYPDHPEGANNLACALRDQSLLDEAIEVLKPSILLHPEVAMLWNTMGTVMGEKGDFESAHLFFAEAMRLDPMLAKAQYNYGNSLLALGDPVGALEACEAAMEKVTAEDERQMMRLARSTILIALGRVGEGFDEYEARLNRHYADVTHFLIKAPLWTPGADIAGKRLLVVAEQGLGDEVLFANLMPDVMARVGPGGHTTLAVERRLVSLFQRSFPEATVTAHATGSLQGRPARHIPLLNGPDAPAVDLFAPMGSMLREFRRSPEAFPQDRPRFLAADPERVAYWREQLPAAGPGRKVGLLWKSALKRSTRQRYFSPFEAWAPVLRQEGITFVNLQYGDCAEELAWVARELGVQVWQPPGIDLKQDLDDVAALACALDLTLGFSNATFNLAAACGAPAWLISTPAAWTLLGTDRYPWYPQARVFVPKGFGAWDELMADIGQALGDWAASEH
ncbi:tetratricopeptide repeat protein [Phenylobacterium sp.]|jgi:tetratricopeptide (TPR) repeat protein|uniref:tetratricopeptide repeat protein n=1 Tax=Phenylobacterium sp. TaxID=1871053 RepID=UPI002F92F529